MEDQAKVLMVCTGNICRSPMAEGLLRHALEERGCSDVSVSSAGTWAHFGDPATTEAGAVVEVMGADISRHESHPLLAQYVNDADLVLCMTSVHLREIEALVPGTSGKVRLMKELVELEPEVPEADARSRIEAVLAAERPRPAGPLISMTPSASPSALTRDAPGR